MQERAASVSCDNALSQSAHGFGPRLREILECLSMTFAVTGIAKFPPYIGKKTLKVSQTSAWFLVF